MTIGRFRGTTFAQIPDNYGDWASEEERQNGANVHSEHQLSPGGRLRALAFGYCSKAEKRQPLQRGGAFKLRSVISWQRSCGCQGPLCSGCSTPRCLSTTSFAGSTT